MPFNERIDRHKPLSLRLNLCHENTVGSAHYELIPVFQYVLCCALSSKKLIANEFIHVRT